MSDLSELHVGQRWSGLLGNRRVNWTVTRVWVKKAQLRAELDYGTCTATVWIERMLDNPEWVLL